MYNLKKMLLLILVPPLFALAPAKGQSTTADINSIAHIRYRNADSKMHAVYSIVLKKAAYFDINGAAKKALIASQRAFLIYREKERLLQEKLYDGGSMLPAFRDKVLKQLTDERTIQLKSYQL